MIFNFGSGIFINAKSTDYIVKFLTIISPFRYTCEALLRTLLRDKDNVNYIYK